MKYSCILLLIFSPIFGILLPLVYAQTPAGDPISAWLQQKRNKLETRLIDDRQREERTEGTLQRSLSIQSTLCVNNDETPGS